jgi:dihydrofolate reductase
MITRVSKVIVRANRSSGCSARPDSRDRTGRCTFEALRCYWPNQPEDLTGVTKHLNEVRKYVVSSTITDPQWQNTTVMRGDPVRNVRMLKEEQARDIVITGSISLCHTLINAELVDEYRPFIYPVVQGRGLFPDGFELARLRLPGLGRSATSSTPDTPTRTSATPSADQPVGFTLSDRLVQGAVRVR